MKGDDADCRTDPPEGYGGEHDAIEAREQMPFAVAPIAEPNKGL